jgi:hypothetical protein
VNVYHIPKLTRPFVIDAHWQKMPWAELPALRIDQFSGEKPIHFPQVQAKLAYDDEALYAIFHVLDRYVCARSQNYQDQVSRDSCVEFFFTPGEDLSQGYFNFEINCGGTVLFHHQKGRRVEDTPVSQDDFLQVDIAHTLPKIVDPEITEPIHWIVEYRLPFKTLAGYTKINLPSSGTSWRANLYKCADGSSHPHWLAWAPINTIAPDFHRPEFFGRLVFE